MLCFLVQHTIIRFFLLLFFVVENVSVGCVLGLYFFIFLFHLHLWFRSFCTQHCSMLLAYVLVIQCFFQIYINVVCSSIFTERNNMHSAQ